MKNKLKNTAIGIVTVIGGMGAVDASVLNEELLKQDIIVANEKVEVRQVDDTVSVKMAWKGEKGITIKHDMGTPSLAERLSDKRDKSVITETVDFGEGGFKVDFILEKQPKTNVFCYQIDGYENYDFFYQPPLTSQEIASGTVRSKDIEGSYAVYHKTLRDNEYKTGKVMQIPRPQVWEVNDKASTTQYADLDFNKGSLCVTVSQEFLDNAIYPVRVDPTFGYTSVGASVMTMDKNGGDHTGNRTEIGGFTGTITTLTSYVSSISASGLSGKITTDDATNDPTDEVISAEISMGNSSNPSLITSPEWLTLSGGTYISDGTESFYMTVEGANGLGGNGTIYYDTVTGYWVYQQGTSPSSFNVEFLRIADRRVSTYATYSVDTMWYDTDWSNRVKIEVPPDDVSSDLTDFPVYFDMSDFPAGTMASMKSACEDIRITTADGSTETPREIVSCNTGTETGEMYFLAPSLSSIATTTFYAYYGNAVATEPAVTATYGAENVWNSNYKGVWHMSETSGTVLDSTNNNTDSTSVTLTTQGSATSKLGSASDFNGTTDNIGFGDVLDLGTNDMTISAWTYLDATSGQDFYLSKSFAAGGNWRYGVGVLQTSNYPRGFMQGNSGGDASPSVSVSVQNTWAYITTVFDRSANATTYLDDGTSSSSVSISAWDTLDFQSNHPFRIGAYTASDNINTLLEFNGRIDEVRVSWQAISPDQIATEYANMNSASTFFVIGVEEDVPSGVGVQMYINNGSWVINNGRIVID